LAIETAHSELGMCDYQHAERSLLAVDVLLPKLVFWIVIKSKEKTLLNSEYVFPNLKYIKCYICSQKENM